MLLFPTRGHSVTRSTDSNECECLECNAFDERSVPLVNICRIDRRCTWALVPNWKFPNLFVETEIFKGNNDLPVTIVDLITESGRVSYGQIQLHAVLQNGCEKLRNNKNHNEIQGMMSTFSSNSPVCVVRIWVVLAGDPSQRMSASLDDSLIPWRANTVDWNKVLISVDFPSPLRPAENHLRGD